MRLHYRIVDLWRWLWNTCRICGLAIPLKTDTSLHGTYGRRRRLCRFHSKTVKFGQMYGMSRRVLDLIAEGD